MAGKQCLTPGCSHVAKSRGICTKCYGTLRVKVQRGEITWDGAVVAGLCNAAGDGPQPGESAMAAAIRRAEEAGKIRLQPVQQIPQPDPDQEPPVQVPAPQQPVAPPPVVQMPEVNAAPEGYGEFDPNAKPAPTAPEPARQPRDEQAPEAIDPLDLIEEADDFDETPEQRQRRQAIERRWKAEQRQNFIEENGFEPPEGGKVVVVPPPNTSYDLNNDPDQQVTGVGAGNTPNPNRPPGVYFEPHDQAAPQTIDGEPLLPGWSLHPDGVNLVNPQGQVVHTDPRIRAQQNPAPAPAGQPAPAPGLQATIPTPVNVNVPTPGGQVANIQGGLILPATLPSNPPAQAPADPVAPAQPEAPQQAAPENTGLIPQGPQPMDPPKPDGQAPWLEE